MADMSTDPVGTKNLELCWKEIQNKKIMGLFGLHWDEMDIRDGIRLCRRTGKLIGFENLSIPKKFDYNVEELCNDDFEESLVTSNGSDKVLCSSGKQ